MKLSIVIPVYNEKDTLEEIVRRVRAVDVPKEIVLVDDFSTDGTRELYETLRGKVRSNHSGSRADGKGAAIREGFKHVTGDLVVVQDADLEYDPRITIIARTLRTGQGRRGVRLPAGRRPAPPRPVLLALHGQSGGDHAVQHVHQLESDRYGGGVQGIQGRGA